MGSLLRKFMQLNMKASRSFDRMLPEKYQIDGNRYFLDYFAPPYIKTGLIIYDIGGGKQPYIKVDLKNGLKLNITGFDIDQNELDRAPSGIYDKTICADITQYQGLGDADLIRHYRKLKRIN